MKYGKKVLYSILAVLLLISIFTGWYYRILITYTSIGTRQNYKAIHPELIDHIESRLPENQERTPEEIIGTSLSITSQYLHFSSDNNDNNPNKLIETKRAHCVGYAAFFASTCNFIFSKYQMYDWEATPHIGKLYFLGINLHKHIDSPFFKDHDFVVIKNSTTGEIFAVDPTVHDYLWIDFITLRQ